MGNDVRPEIEESGKRLATFFRKGFARDNRPDVELRVVLDAYDGKPFVTIRQWEAAYGRMVPTKRGTSIRIAEIPGLIEALERAQLEADAGKKVAERGEDMPPQRTLREPREPRGRRGGSPQASKHWQAPPYVRGEVYRPNPVPDRLPTSGATEFDEFGDDGGSDG